MHALATALFLLCDVQTESATQRLLLYLARHQNDDGSWGSPPDRCTCPSLRPLLVRLPIVPDRDTERRFRELCEAFQDDRPAERERAQRRIFDLGTPVIPLLQEAAEHPDAEIRGRCLDILGDFWRKKPAVKAWILQSAFPGVEDLQVKATSLALLNFLGAGYSHFSRDELPDPVDRTLVYKYGPRIKLAVRWLLDHQKEDGSFPAVHPETQALAATALSEYFGMTALDVVKEPAQRAVTYTLELDGKDVSFCLWREFARESARLSELRVFPGNPDALLRRLDPDDSVRSTAGTILVSTFLKRSCVRADGRLLRLPPAEMSPEDRFLATLAVDRSLPPGTAERSAWTQPLFSDWCKLQVTSIRCDRGAFHSSPVDYEECLIETLYNGLALEYIYRYANVMLAKNWTLGR